MNKLVRGVVAGSIIGAAVGLVMLKRRNQNMAKMSVRSDKLYGHARGTAKMVKDNAMRWTSAVKSGTEAFSRKLANRLS